MCWMLCSFTVLLRETKAEVKAPCGRRLCLTPGGTRLAVGVVLQKLADSLKGLSVVQPPLPTEQTVVIENRIGLLQLFINT